MAASQKKTGGKRTSSGGTRRSGSASGSSRGNSRGSKAPARRPMRREIGAAVCLALGLFPDRLTALFQSLAAQVL